MNVYFIVTKRLFTSLLSTFDIVSDLVNSCDFLGYSASKQIINLFYGGSDLPKTDDPCQISPVSNGTLNTTFQVDAVNNSICAPEEDEETSPEILGVDPDKKPAFSLKGTTPDSWPSEHGAPI